MDHPMHRVTSFEIVAPYRIRVDFADGISQTIDFEPMLEGEMFGPLRDPDAFGRVVLDAEAHTLAWPNGADFDPATLHDWPQHEAELRRMASSWAASARAARPVASSLPGRD